MHKKQFKLQFRVKRKKKEFVLKDIKYTWISQLYSIHAPRLHTSNHSNETIWSWNFSESGEKTNTATSPFVCLPCSEIYFLRKLHLIPGYFSEFRCRVDYVFFYQRTLWLNKKIQKISAWFVMTYNLSDNLSRTRVSF